MELAKLVVDFVLKGAGVAQAGIEDYTKAVAQAAKGTAALDAAEENLSKTRTSLTRLRRIAGAIGGEEKGGAQAAGQFGAAGAAKQAAPVFEQIRLRTIAEAAANAQLSESMTKVLFGFGAAASAAGKYAYKLEAVQSVLSPILKAANKGFDELTSRTKSWVMAGMAGTAYQTQLNYQFQRISQEVAAIFLPVFQQVIDITRRVADWFSQLSGAQQNQIMRWVLIGAAVLGTVVILGKALAMAESAAVAYQTWTTGMGKFIIELFGAAAAHIGLAGAAGTAAAAEVAAAKGAAALAAAEGAATAGILPLIGALVTGALALGAFFVATETGCGVLGRIGTYFSSIGSLLQELGSIVWSLISPWVDFDAVLLDVAATLGSALFIEPAIAGVKMLAAALEPVVRVMRGLSTGVGLMFESAGNAAIRLMGIIANLLGKPFDSLKGLFDGLLDTIEDVISRLAMAVALAVYAQSRLSGDTLEQSLDKMAKTLISFHKQDSQPGAGHTSVSPGTAGFEDVQAKFKRIQEAFTNADTGPTDAQKQLAAAEKANDKLDQIKDKLDDLKPAFA